MSLEPHPDSERIRRALERLRPQMVSWSGLFFRIAAVRYANSDDLLSGIGSRLTGGRWTPKGGPPSVYGSLDIETMIAEIYGRARQAGFRPEDLTPRVIVAIQAELRSVLDLTTGSIRSRLRVGSDRMTVEPWRELQQRSEEALTQAIGRCAWEIGCEALFVPSAARSGGTNLVLFPGNLSVASRLAIRKVEDLPPRMLP